MKLFETIKRMAARSGRVSTGDWPDWPSPHILRQIYATAYKASSIDAQITGTNQNQIDTVFGLTEIPRMCQSSALIGLRPRYGAPVRQHC